MKRKIIGLAVLTCLATVPSFAQPAPFNTTLTHPDYFFWDSRIAIPAPQGEIIVGAYVEEVATGENKYALMRFGPAGNYLPPSLVRDSSWNSDRILETFDGTNPGILVASQLHDYLLVRKYDLALNLLWSIKIDKANPMQFSSVFTNVDIEAEKGPNGADMYYYIVFTSGPNDDTYDQDNAISVAKIDGTGTLQWHKVYTDANRAQYDPLEVVRDKPYSITSFPDPNDANARLYAIAGSREFYYLSAALSTFYMVIDQSGNIVTQYKRVETATNHYYPDIIYDGDSLAVSFLQTIVNNEPSGYAIMKTDIGLSAFRGMAYTNDCENYAHTISYDGTDYIIGGWAGRCTQTNPYEKNPSLLRIHKNSLAALDYKRFNLFQEVWGVHHRTETINFTEHFITGFTNHLYSPWNTQGVRLIKTDNVFRTCGDEDMDVEPEEIDPDVTEFEYEAVEYTDWAPIEFNEIEVDFEYDVCVEDGSEAYYKPGTTGLANMTAINNVQVAINPTKVDGTGTPVICKINSPTALDVTIDIFNISGQKVTTQTHAVTAGESTLRINTSNVHPGLHFVKVTGNNQLLMTEKVNFMN